ncbi:hypothetical protein NIES2100_14780 [Calothrix sp. NIES-2100]|uniref:two-partner secretion domain-containing protein n=1 Tax=Calothrix sp. NIES-2100 TaxID=1954172 RepID=UPI000B622A31|nr:hypothetical protein NIES2100_14780 [Calothrix sp. NIES-2100]
MLPFFRQQLGKLGLVILLATSSVITTSTNSAQAQIVPDSTLGAETTKLTPNVNVKDLPATVIEGGATRGINLFHSFLQFNVGEGQRVYFANPAGIENILTRVTGNDPSKIFGTLGVDGRANLFFLNPNGIIFGANARLDVAGSFLATTANSFVFDNGLKFSATNPGTAPLLTVSLRPGLQFAANQSRSISNSGNLSVGQDLTLVGGNLDLQGSLQAGRNLTLQAQDTVKLRDTATNPLLIDAGEQLILQGNQNIDIFALNHPDSGLLSGADMVLRSNNTVAGDAQYWAGGNFRIEKLDGNLGNLFSPNDPIIRASGDVRFSNYEGASLHILAGGAVNIENITITGADIINPGNAIAENVPLSISLSNGTNSVAINGRGEPTLDIRAGTTAFGTPGLTPNPIPGMTEPVNPNAPRTNADIKIGSIFNLNKSPTDEPIKGNIILTNQYAPNGLPGNIKTGAIFTFGNVTIDSRGDIETNGAIDISLGLDSNNNIQLIANNNIFIGGDLLSDLGGIGSGNGGNITLISKNGGINTRLGEIISTTPNGLAGDVFIAAPGDIYVGQIKASSHFDEVDENYPGKLFSSINIKSTGGSVYLNNSQIDTTNTGVGYAGDVNISAIQEVRVENESKISSLGNAGRIFIGKSEDANFSPSIVNIVDSSLITDNPGLNGSAGDINIAGVNGISITNSKIFSNVTAAQSIANAGGIYLKSIGSLSLTDSAIVSDVAGGTGNAGNLSFNAGSISLERTELKTNNNGLGAAGNISINANKKDISINDSQAMSESKRLAVNDNYANTAQLFGSIQITANQGSVILNRSRVSTTNSGGGFAGNIIINALNDISLIENSAGDGSLTNGIFSNGNSGNIFIGYDSDNTSLIPKKVTLAQTFLTTSNQVQLKDIETILEQNAGNIIVKSLGDLSLISSNLESATYSSGSGGYISVEANSVSLSNSSSLLADTLGTGKAGSVTVNTNGGVVSLSHSSINTGSDEIKLDPNKPISEGKGGGGDINITTGSLLLTNFSRLNASTFGSGASGKIKITADTTVSFTDYSLLNASTYVEGDAGDINIKAQSVDFSNESLIQAQTFGSGKAGNIDIITPSFSLSSSSRIDAQTFASGDAGNINIATQLLSLTEGSRLNADTLGSGKGGNITISPLNNENQAAAIVSIFGTAPLNGFSSGLFVNTESAEPNAGSGGNIMINTGNLNIKDGAVLSASSNSSGIGGDIEINVKNLEITGGGQILTNTFKSGEAGSIKITATDNITIAGQDLQYEQRLAQFKAQVGSPESDREARRLLGSMDQYSGLFANTEVNSTGNGGTINIDPVQVTIKDEAKISVDSQGTGVAGDISITGDRLSLDNHAKITADTNSGAGGRITLNLKDLLLFRRQSVISTTAGKEGAGGDGGAIAINLNPNQGFIVSAALENNDIAANAFSGSGGIIEISAKGVIGLATLTREELEAKLGTTNPQKLDPQFLDTNDITAISQTDPQLNGIVSISSPDIDPSKGIVSLPTNASDPSQQIAQSCGAVDEKIASAFTDTGRGGLPPKPDEFVSSNPVWQDVRLRASNTSQPGDTPTTAAPSKQKAVLIMPATGWVFNNKGEVTLISQTPHASWVNSSSCAVKN